MKYIYGAAFDPITIAHLEIIRQIIKMMQPNDTLDILVSNNDEKNYQAASPDRIDLVNIALKAKFQNITFNVVEQKFRMYRHLYEAYKDDTDITIVMGQDQWESLTAGKWVNGDQLLKKYKFFVFARGNGQLFRVEDNAYKVKKTVLGKKAEGVSSTYIREVFDKNPDTHYDALRKMITHAVFRAIKEKELYHQNGPDYDKKLDAFLKEYAVKKEKNHWGEPSTTTDTVAYNGKKVLLIRRGNYPYKNYWCLPGGFFDKTDKDLNYGAARELREETHIDIEPKKFELINAYGHNFDPRMKICDVAFAVRVPHEQMKNAVGDDDAADARWFDLNDLPALGFHHAQIIEDFLKKIKDN